MVVTIHDYRQLNRFLFLYRSFLFKRVFFISSIKDEEILKMIEALNLKKRKERITYVLEEACNYIDNYYKNRNVCKFKNNKCDCHRALKKEIENGCCFKCKYQSANGCTTKNVACKLFLCSYAKRGIVPLDEKEIAILKILTRKERYIMRYDFFSNISDVTKDIYYGFCIGGLRIEYRYLKTKWANKKRKKYQK